MQAQILSSPLSYRYLLNHSASKTLAFSRKHLNSDNPFSAPKRNCKLNGFSPVGVFRRNLDGWKRKRGGTVYSSAEELNTSTNTLRKRKVIEHICLLQGKEDLSEEQEKNMLDYLYTTQYQMRGIIAISLGRVSGWNSVNCTHAVYVRFQRKEDLAMFYENHFYTGVIKDHVMPYCHGIKSVDFESEVEDDILPIFRKGEEFNFGLELLLLIEFVESSLDGAAEDALIALDKLTMEFPSLIVQTTNGSNFNRHSEEYTHGVVIRFRSSEAFEIFMNSSEYIDMWRSKFQPIIRKAIPISYSVDPVGTELM
ncbi:PREDICTED: stress-response A/B barrel domain-containing protein UP3 isoform X2 [Ipomoea nil]|uniref:stress-response A/B barrel domain-containing protein UP3 isoform X2 n=1 Tax=Ipomoea nil TaxID=35883 RepID=UPI000900B530|nr:PREDICTED: stress-response A/B barrel domain-containing protein UP3 isoform X2 [Ipomoea nil]